MISIRNTKIVYVYLPPSDLGCDLEFGFSSFELENPLIAYIIKIFDRAAIVRPLGRCRIVAGEVNRDGKRATRRAAPAYTRSVHVQRAVQQPIRWRVYSSMSRPRERSSAPRAKVCLTFFRGAGNLSIHLWSLA